VDHAPEPTVAGIVSAFALSLAAVAFAGPAETFSHYAVEMDPNAKLAKERFTLALSQATP
jgi:hypothetical protein